MYPPQSTATLVGWLHFVLFLQLAFFLKDCQAKNSQTFKITTTGRWILFRSIALHLAQRVLYKLPIRVR